MSATEMGKAYVSVEFSGDVNRKVAAVGRDVERGFSATTGRVGASMTGLGSKMSLGLTAPLVAFGAKSFTAFAGFDKTMRQVGVQTDQSGKSLDTMRELALKMGKDTSFSAGQAADAMLELSKGGMSAAEIQAGGLQQTLTLAAAGGLELGAAGSYMSNTLNTFGLAAKDANKVAAALAGGANASTASVESLGQALSQVGPGAKLAGLSLNETIAALAAFDNAGIKGSDAGTSLKTMLSRLSPTTTAASKAMGALGLNFVDAEGAFLPLAQVAEQLKTKLAGLSAEQKTTALTTIFGSDAYRAAAILTDQGAAGLQKYEAATRDLGAAEKLAKTNTEGAAGSIEAMGGSIETAQISIGKVLAPAVIDLAGKVARLANAFSDLDPHMQRTAVAFGAVAAVMGPVLIVVGQVIRAIGSIVSALRVVAPFLGKALVGGFRAVALILRVLMIAFRVLAPVLRVLMIAFRVLGIALAAIGTTAGIVVLVIAAIVAALVICYVKVEAFRNAVNATGKAILNFGKMLVTGVVGALRAVASAAVAAWRGIMAGADVFLRVADVITQPLQGIVQVVRGIVSVIAGIFTGDMDRVASGVAGIIGGIVRTFAGLPVRVIGAVAPLVPGLLSFAGRAIAGLVRVTAAGIVTVVKWYLSLPGRALSAVLSLVGLLASLGTRALAALVSACRIGGAAVLAFMAALPGRVAAQLVALPGRLSTLGAAALEKLAAGARTGAGAVLAFFRALPATIVGALGDVGGLLLGIGGAIIDGLVQGIKGAAHKVMDAVKAITDKIPDVVQDALGISSPSTVFAGIGTDIMAGLERGVTRSRSGVLGALGDVASEVAGYGAQMRGGLAFGASGSLSAATGAAVRGAIPRQLTAPVAGERGQVTVNVYNPVPEPASETVPAALRKLAYQMGA